MTKTISDAFTALYRTMDIQDSIINLLDTLITSHIHGEEARITQALLCLQTMDVDFAQSLPQGVFVSVMKSPGDVMTREMLDDMRRVDAESDALNELYHARTVYAFFICDALLLTTYAAAERYLLMIAELCQAVYQKQHSPYETGDRGVQAAVNYLVREVQIGAVKQQPTWRRFYRWNKIRNALAHNHGRCRENDRAALGRFVTLNTAGYVLLSFDDCRTFVKDTREFAAILEQAIIAPNPATTPISQS